MSSQKDAFDELEQYDFLDEEYLEKVVDKYSPLVGLFLINFSCLEHELNLAIADFFGDDYHETGYVIIEKLTTSNKIELFYKIYARLESFKDKKNKDALNKIRQQLELINAFRNSIVHANWQSLSKDGFVRTKIIVDNQEGYVKFNKIQITPKIIREKTKEIGKLIEKIDGYKETAFQF